MSNEEIEKDIEDESRKHCIDVDDSFAWRDFEAGAKLYAQKYIDECEQHEKTKLELENARQLCRNYSEMITAGNNQNKLPNF